MNKSIKIASPVVLALLLLLTLMNTSCHKKKWYIDYPVSTNYGENLLRITDDSLSHGDSYSMETEITKKCFLKIVLTNLSEQSSDPAVPLPKWGYDYNTGWEIGNYENGSQTFITNKTGRTDMKIVFSGTPGSCRIDYYENSSDVSKSKTVKW